MKKGFKIEETDQFICLQFSFSNPDNIPASIQKLPEGKRLRQETDRDMERRERASLGETLMEPAERLHVSSLRDQLSRAGYELVDVVCENRLQWQRSTLATFTMLRYTFASRAISPSILKPEFIRMQRELMLGLDVLLCQAFWRMRVFRNQEDVDRDVIPIDADHVAIRLEVREPAWEKGEPVMRWVRDEKTGDKLYKKRFRPNHVFSLLLDGHGILLPASVLD